jgi:hypothetical protein
VLARELGDAMFDLDDVAGPLTAAALEFLGYHEEDLDSVPQAAQLRTARYASLLRAARSNIELGRGVIVIAPFSQEIVDPSAWREVTSSLVQSGRGGPNATVRLIYVACPPQMLVDRLRQRGEARDRHKIDGPDGSGGVAERRSPVIDHIEIDGLLPTTDQVTYAISALDEAGDSAGEGARGTPC